jgi:thiosulfate dehydrogenase
VCSSDLSPPIAAGSIPADSTLRAPNGDRVPSGEMGRSILRGHAILAATRDSLPDHVGATLRCTSCHLGDGRRENALPLTGVYGRFPQYRSRAAAVQRLEDRINDCFLRSMNGSALAFDDPAMRDIVTYLAFISRGAVVADPSPPLSTGPLAGDTTAGATVFATQCARCHGADGGGISPYPPLWGPKSYNVGAGMARLRTLNRFVRQNMPYDKPGTLSDADATNVAAYVASRPRPDFAGKERDWPRGGAPEDAPYPTLAGKKP